MLLLLVVAAAAVMLLLLVVVAVVILLWLLLCMHTLKVTRSVPLYDCVCILSAVSATRVLLPFFVCFVFSSAKCSQTVMFSGHSQCCNA